MMAVLALIVVLGVLIFVHELGHFMAAKWAGIYVHRFSLGLGSPIKALTFKRGETEYSVSWLPLGGYVKMASAEEEAMGAALEGGETAVQVPPHRMFEAQPLWKRIIVILAGVTMNMIFAWLVYSGIALQAGKNIVLETRIGAVDSTYLPKGGEALGSLAPGDRILAINADTVHSWNDVADALQNSSGDALRLTMASGHNVVLAIPAEAVGERIKATLALQPWRAPVLATVDSAGPAGRAGLQTGDSVTVINGTPITQWSDLHRIIEELPNATVAITAVRNGQSVDFRVATDSQVVADTGKATRTVGHLGVGSPVSYTHLRAHETPEH